MPKILALLFFACSLFAVTAAAEDPPVPVKKAGGKKKQGARPKAQPTLSDEETLKKADLSPTDGEKLLAYLKTRTLSDSDQGRMGEIIARLGADDFDDREKAMEEIEAFGPAAVGPLKKEADKRDGDPEVGYRARLVLKRLEKVPHSAVTAAAIRALVKLKPDGTTGVLLNFLPLADTEGVADAIREALVDLADRGGKADPVLLGALADPSPVRRAAAYVALTEGGPKDKGVRFKDAYPELRAAVLKETDVETKFTGLWSLALTTREKEYVPALIDLIPKLPRGRIWQLEELLLTLAGEHPKGGRFLKSPESLVKARDAWVGWWKEKGENLDFAGLEYDPQVLGVTDIIEMDYRGYGQGRVISLGPDLKEKWRITGVNNPTDMKITPDGHVWIVESNNNRLSEWLPGGAKALTMRNVNTQPLCIDLLPDGGMLMVGRHQIVQWDKDGKQEWMFQRPNYDVMGGRRLPNGETLFVTNTPQRVNQPAQQNVFRLDAKGKEINAPKAKAKGKNAKAPDPKDPKDPKGKDGADANEPPHFNYIYQMQSMGLVGDDHVLVCERDMSTPGRYVDRVAEYDLKTGKAVWHHDCPRNSAPTSCQRLRNGNTLICMMNTNQLIEVDPSGEVVWEYQAKDGLKVGRAYRR